MKRPYCLVITFMFACGPEVANPTGSCTAPSDGSRRGYHGANGAQWLPHCQNPLKREYWRVFAEDDRTAATIPRIDGEPLLAPVCGDSQHMLHALVEKYRLCQPASDQQTVALVNAMLPADALAITFFLHGRLRFRAEEGKGGRDVRPYTIPSDVVDACQLRKATRSPALVAVCEEVQTTLKNGWDKGIDYGPAAPELADRLNELYGVAASE